jgi:hypothetical protein
LRDAETQPGVGGIKHLTAVPAAEVDAVLLLEAALRHSEARIGEVFIMNSFSLAFGVVAFSNSYVQAHSPQS